VRILLWIGIGWIAIIAVVWRILYVLHRTEEMAPSPELLEMPSVRDREELPAGGGQAPNPPR
jgi:hypothetical protein